MGRSNCAAAVAGRFYGIPDIEFPGRPGVNFSPPRRVPDVGFLVHGHRDDGIVPGRCPVGYRRRRGGLDCDVAGDDASASDKAIPLDSVRPAGIPRYPLSSGGGVRSDVVRRVWPETVAAACRTASLVEPR